MTAGCVAVAGVIGFVGLVVPHVLRMLLGGAHGPLLYGAFLGGGILLVWADVLARCAFRRTGIARGRGDGPCWAAPFRFSGAEALMLRAKGIRAAYGTDEIVHGVDIDLHPGEAVALLGPNGSGKTTLLRVLAGSLTPTAGSVQVQGRTSAVFPPGTARRVAVLSQRNAAPRGMTALQMVLLGRYPWLGWWGSYSAEDRRIAHEALEETGALPLAGRQVSELSGGGTAARGPGPDTGPAKPRAAAGRAGRRSGSGPDAGTFRPAGAPPPGRCRAAAGDA